MGAYRLEVLAVLDVRPLAFSNAQHHPLTGAVNICVKQANLGTLGIQREGQIYRCGRFTHTALAAAHQHDVFDLTETRTTFYGKVQLQIDGIHLQKGRQLNRKICLQSGSGISQGNRNLVARSEHPRAQAAPRLPQIGVDKFFDFHRAFPPLLLSPQV